MLQHEKAAKSQVGMVVSRGADLNRRRGDANSRLARLIDVPRCDHLCLAVIAISREINAEVEKLWGSDDVQVVKDRLRSLPRH